MNPTVRAFAIILAIVAVVMVFQLYATLTMISTVLSIAFLLAIVFFVYSLWRERRADIGRWSGRSRFAFYGGIFLLFVNLGFYLVLRFVGVDSDLSGPIMVAWLLVFPICAYALWRVWRDEHTYL
jgi:hypothetical protein